jgi:hypothetical protein
MRTVRQLLLLDYLTVAILAELVVRFTSIGVVEGPRSEPNSIQFGDEGVPASRALNLSHLITSWDPFSGHHLHAAAQNPRRRTAGHELSPDD